MADSFSCWVNPNASAAEVSTQLERLRTYTDISFDKAVLMAEDLAAYQVPTLSFNADEIAFDDFPISDPTGLVPELDEAIVTMPSLPEPPSLQMPSGPASPGPAPERPADAAPPVFGLAPTVYDPTFGPAPTTDLPDVPVYGDYTGDIPEPELYDITLPAVPDIDIDGIKFEALRPIFTAVEPDAADFNYVEQAYDPLMVDQLVAKMTTMLNGENGIPAPVVTAIWSREIERESEQAARAEQEVIDDWAARGFSRPGGPVESLLHRIRQNSQNQRNTLGRDVAIKEIDVLLDQLKFAVSNGIALEQVWVGLYSSVQDRRLQAAQVAVNIAIAVFNAKVSLFNAEMQAYQIDANVYRERIQAEIAKIQVYAEQIRAQSLIGQLNQQLVDIYRARLSAVETNVRVFAAMIQAYSAQIDGERLKLETYRTTIEAEQAKLQASNIEAQIFSQLVQAESIKQQASLTRAQAYTANVSAWSAQYQALIDKFKAEMQKIDGEVRLYDARIRGVEGVLAVARTRIEEVSTRNQSRIQGFTAITEAASTVNDAQARRALARNETNKANAEISLKNGEINMTNATRVSELLLEAIQGAARVLTQLASGAMSAGSVSASITDSTTAGSSCSYSTSQVIE